MRRKLLLALAMSVAVVWGDSGASSASGSAALLMKANLDAVRAAEFRKLTGADGSGVLIAVVDTGVDPLHPDLLSTSKGQAKVVDWVDFSGEGYVDTRQTARQVRGRIRTPMGEFKVGSIPSLSGTYRYGFFQETQIQAGSDLGQDADLDGMRGEAFGVLVTDLFVAGRYEVVYVDTDGDYDFTDEVPLRPFRKARETARFGKGLAFVAARIDPDGASVSLGFDGNGHGTHVAGVAAGYNTDGFAGVAPGAQLMVLKALSSSGEGTWEHISRAMDYAVANGAHVVSVSVAAPQADGSARSTAREPLVFLAAGNNGPGLGSLSSSPGPWASVTVGAYVNPAAEKSLGRLPPPEGVWYFSGVGPSGNGSLLPDLLAPGNAISSVPLWQDPSGRSFFEGTSMAVPYGAGVAALMIQAAREKGIKYDAASLKRAMLRGARRLEGFHRLEQGHGLLDAVEAWRNLSSGAASRNRAFEVRRPLTGSPGVAARGSSPAEILFEVWNPGSEFTRLRFTTSEKWLEVPEELVSIPPRRAGQLRVRYNLDAEPGLYTGYVYGWLEGSRGADPAVEIPSIVLIPYRLREGDLSVRSSVGAGRRQRFFMEVPRGTRSLWVRFSASQPEQGADLRFHLIRPDGQPAFSEGASGERWTFYEPEPGVWEVVVTAVGGPGGSEAGAYSFALGAGAEGIYTDTPSLKEGEAGTFSRELVFFNRYKDFQGGALGGGFARGNLPREWAYLKSLTGASVTRNVSEILPGTRLLRIAVSNPDRPGVDLDLYLYRYVPAVDDWEEFAVSARRGTAYEVIQVESPPPGHYVAYVQLSGPGGPAVSFQYRETVIPGGNQIQAVSSTRTLKRGENWRFPALVRMPEKEGEYYGYLWLRDSVDASMLMAFPVEARPGKPRLTVQLTAKRLVAGEEAMVGLSVRDAVTLAPADAVVEVNGLTYDTRKGELSLKLAPPEGRMELRVKVDDPRYAPVYREYSLPVFKAVQPPPALAESPGYRKQVADRVARD